MQFFNALFILVVYTIVIITVIICMTIVFVVVPIAIVDRPVGGVIPNMYTAVSSPHDSVEWI